jgi:hypothetical protein
MFQVRAWLSLAEGAGGGGAGGEGGGIVGLSGISSRIQFLGAEHTIEYCFSAEFMLATIWFSMPLSR